MEKSVICDLAAYYYAKYIILGIGQSMHIYSKKNLAKFHSNQIWNTESLIEERRASKNHNKMNSDVGSVSAVDELVK